MSKREDGRYSFVQLDRDAPPIARIESFSDLKGDFYVELSAADGTPIALISGFENRDQAEWHAIWAAWKCGLEVRLC